MTALEKVSFVDSAARRNLACTFDTIRQQSGTLRELKRRGRVVFVTAMYNIATGDVEFLNDGGASNLLLELQSERRTEWKAAFSPSSG